MKSNKPDAAQIWKQLEDLLVPRLRLSITDRVVYSHLLRHSRLEGRTRLRFSIAWLARGARLSTNPPRWPVLHLIPHRAHRRPPPPPRRPRPPHPPAPPPPHPPPPTPPNPPPRKRPPPFPPHPSCQFFFFTLKRKLFPPLAYSVISQKPVPITIDPNNF